MGAQRRQRAAVALHRPRRTRAARRGRQGGPDLPCDNRIDIRDEQAHRRRSNPSSAQQSRHLRVTRPCRRIHLGTVHGIQERVRLGVPAGWIDLPRDAELLSRRTRPRAGRVLHQLGVLRRGAGTARRRSAFPTSGSSRGISLWVGRAEAMVRFADARSPMWSSAIAGIPSTPTSSTEEARVRSVGDARRLFVIRDRPCQSLLVADALHLVQRLIQSRADPLAGCEGHRSDGASELSPVPPATCRGRPGIR